VDRLKVEGRRKAPVFALGCAETRKGTKAEGRRHKIKEKQKAERKQLIVKGPVLRSHRRSRIESFRL
jgi:hypothetical protein